MLICFKISMEWLETGIGLNLENYGFSICIGPTTGWTSWNDYVVANVGSIMETTCSTNITSSTLMLWIT
jgi:hypothetical protein